MHSALTSAPRAPGAKVGRRNAAGHASSSIPRAAALPTGHARRHFVVAGMGASSGAGEGKPSSGGNRARKMQSPAVATDTPKSTSRNISMGSIGDCVRRLDEPTPGFASIEDALKEIAEGRFLVVSDDEDRENEGDLILAASKATEESIAFMVNNTSGLICVAMEGKDLDRLNIPLMIRQDENDDAMGTAFTVSVDLLEGTSTGISAADRAATLNRLADSDAMPSDFRRPGHVFPLRYRPGGVLVRPGHTEAAADLSRLAGLPPVGVLCEIVNKDGSMSRLPQLKAFGEKTDLMCITIADLVRYIRMHEPQVERMASARLPTEYGEFEVVCYKGLRDGEEHVALVMGGEGIKEGGGEEVLARVHSECLTGDIFSSSRCDCGPQLQLAMKKVAAAGRGVIVYMKGHEGRGIGLGSKLLAYNLQDKGRDTVDANLDLGLPADAREYDVAAHIFKDLGVRTIRLMSNNPDKFTALEEHGLAVVERVPVITPINPENKKYIDAKKNRMRHIFDDKADSLKQ